MGKPTGFMEYKRETAKYRSAKERIKDWNEFYQDLPEEEQKKQAARCMDCGVPFCHMGIKLNGLMSGCPLNNLIPEWNDLLYRGKYEEALKRLLKTNNFPEFTCRVCPAPCEGACTNNLYSTPVTIKSNERTIIETAFKEGWVKPEPPKIRTECKVAIIGSGPAGLVAADDLNKRGHQVTVFEREDRLGGLLMYGIPNMKLDKGIIERRLEILKAEGITFVTNTALGKDIFIPELLKEYDAVVLCIGATKARDLPVEGRDATGIHMAVDYLTKNTKSLLDSKFEDKKYIDAKGKDVIVIGGGDTGTDCVASAIRQGCKSVTQLEIMPKPSAERNEQNPWPEFPRTLKVDYGQQESIEVFGRDPRDYEMMTQKFVKDTDGNINEIHAVQVNWEKVNGRMTPVPIKGSEKVYKADLVFLALGFVGIEEESIEHTNIRLDASHRFKSFIEFHNTVQDGVFMAGDARIGQSLVVTAMKEGKDVAKVVDEYLLNL